MFIIQDIDRKTVFSTLELWIASLFGGWYFFLKTNDPRFFWPEKQLQTTGGSHTPLPPRKKDNWSQYALITTDQNTPVFVTQGITALWYRVCMFFLPGDRCWIYTHPIAPNTKVQMGSGEEPMTIRCVTLAGSSCSEGRAFMELRRHTIEPDADIWTDLSGETIVSPPEGHTHI